MIAFGLGTLPTLLTIGAVAARVAELTRVRWVRRLAGMAIVIFGLLHVAAASAQIAGNGTSSPAPGTCCAGHHHGG
jgi:sulfite exporter TauE/SafE